jgi:hypothetical protein
LPKGEAKGRIVPVRFSGAEVERITAAANANHPDEQPILGSKSASLTWALRGDNGRVFFQVGLHFRFNVERGWMRTMDIEWIKQSIDSTRNNREMLLRQADIRLLDAQLIEAKAATFWEEILFELNAYVRTFNNGFPDDQLRHVKMDQSSTGNVVTIKNTDYPNYEVSLKLNVPAQQVEIRRVDYWQDSAVAGHQPPYHLVVLPDGRLGLKGISLDDVLKLMLGRIFQGAQGRV